LVINKCVTAVKVSKFSGHYLRNRSTLDIGFLGYIGIVQHKEHSPEVLSIPPGKPCIYVDTYIYIYRYIFIYTHASIHTCTHTYIHTYPPTHKGKAFPLQAWSGPEGSRKIRFPDFMTTVQDGGKVVSLTHRPPLPPGNTPGTHFC